MESTIKPDAMLTLDEAMRKLADLSANGRTWPQCLMFIQLKGAVMAHTSWTAEEFSAQLEAAKKAGAA